MRRMMCVGRYGFGGRGDLDETWLAGAGTLGEQTEAGALEVPARVSCERCKLCPS